MPGSASVGRVRFYVDGKLLATRLDPPYVVGWDTSESVNGSHRVRVRATDAGGNVGTSAITVRVRN